MRRLASVILMSLGLFACGETNTWLAAPPNLQASGSIVAGLVEPSRVQLFAFEARLPIELPYPSEPEVTRIELLFYLEDLAELGLTSGEIALARPEEPSHPLLPPDDLWGRAVLDESGTAWVQDAALSPALSEVRLPGAPVSACDELERRVILLPELRRGVGSDVAETLADGRVIMSFTGTTALALELDESVTWLRIDDGRPLHVHAVEAHSDGSLWLQAPHGGGVLVQARVLSNQIEILQTVPSLPSAALELVLGGPTNSGSPHVFMLHRGGLLSHFDGTSIAEVGQLSPADNQWGGLTRRGVNEAYVVWNGDVGLLAVGPEGLRRLRVVGLSEALSLTTIAGESDGSLFAAAADGTLFRISEGRDATPLQAGVPERQTYTSILPFEGGFVAGGRKGTLVRFMPPHELCSLSSPEISGSVNDIAPFGDGFVLAVDVDDEEVPRIVYFRKRAK